MVVRYWLPKDKTYFEDGGFLIDPERSEWLRRDVRTLDEADVLPCVLLLGEPGMGKSTTIVQHVERACLAKPSSVDIQLHDLKSFGESDLRHDLFGSQWFAEWRQSDRALHLFLDSLDECMGRVEHIAQALRRSFSGLSQEERSRLRLRIACRTGQLPETLKGWVQELWKQPVTELELLPLRRDDVLTIAKERQHPDPDGFLAEISENRLGALASRPITLDLLLRYSNANRLPKQRTKIYQDGCLALCKEPDPDRRSLSQEQKRLDPSDRLCLARGLAAATVLTQRLVITLDESDPAEAGQAMSIDEFLRHASCLFVSPTAPSRAAVLEVLTDTALFTSAGAGRFRWQHQTYAEFLAASWLCDQHFHDSERLSLLSSDERPEVITRSLQTVGAWLAALRPSVLDRLVKTQPEVLMESDMAAQDEAVRAAVCESLLRQYDRGALFSYRLDSTAYRPLAHEALAKQLRPYLEDKTRNEAVRSVAALIAWGSRRPDVLPLLCSLATDPSELYSLRLRAVHALADIKDRDSLQRLRPLCRLPAEQDPDDEMAATILSALWDCELLTPEEAFGSLRQPRRSNVIGGFHILPLRFARSLPVAALPTALEWMTRQDRSSSLSYSVLNACQTMAAQAIKNIDAPGVLPALAQVVQRRLQLHDHPLFLENPRDKDSVPTQTVRRKLILAVMENVTDPDELPSQWVLPPGRWLGAEDEGWLLDLVKTAPTSHRRSWCRLLRNFVNLVTPVLTDPVIAAAYELPELMAEFEDLLLPVELGSAKADELQKSHQEELVAVAKYRQRDEEIREWQRNQPSVERLVTEAIEQARQNEVLRWESIANAFSIKDPVHPSSHLYGEPDPTGQPIWKLSSDEIRQQMLDAATAFLKTTNPPTAPTDSPQFYTSRSPGFLAFRLLFLRADTKPLAIGAGVWAKWAEVLVMYPWGGGARAPLWRHLYRAAPTEFLASLERLLQDERRFGDVPRALKDGEWLDTRCVRFLLSWAQRRRANGQRVGSVFSLLLSGTDPECRSWVSAQLPSQVSANGDTRTDAISAAHALLCVARPPVWTALKPLLTQDIGFMCSVLDSAFDVHLEQIEDSWLKRLPEDSVADLYIFLHRHFPGDDPTWGASEDAGTEMQSGALDRHRPMTRNQHLYQTKSMVWSELSRRVSAEGVASVQRIVQEFPQDVALRRLLEYQDEAYQSQLLSKQQPSVSALARRIGDLRGAARQRLGRALPTDADVVAFATDYFPHVASCFGDGMERTQKLNLLLERAEPDELSARLAQYRKAN